MIPFANIPVLAIVGRSNSGKTTVVEGLVRELVARGRRVATVKHHPKATETDTPNTDSWRHARAGAVVSMLSTPRMLATVERLESEPRLAELANRAEDAEILIAEGYTRSAPARIEIVRAEVSNEPLCAPGQLVGIVADRTLELPEYAGIARFEPSEIAELATFVERAYLSGGGGDDN